MINYKMLLSYDGSAFQGWQRLGQGEKTIQGVLEDTIREVTGKKVEVIGSGRTDAGVHARGQVANFKIDIPVEPCFREKMNQLLQGMAILQINEASEGFHSRYRATGKEYCYYVDTNERPSVFERKYVYHFPRTLDLDAMKKASLYLLGKHDFTAFTDEKRERTKIREVCDIHLSENAGKIELCYEADGFLYHMVRIMTGTLLEVGTGQREAEDILRILKSAKRSEAGFLAPAEGLFLNRVYYS